MGSLMFCLLGAALLGFNLGTGRYLMAFVMLLISGVAALDVAYQLGKRAGS